MSLVPAYMKLPEELKAQAQAEAKRLGVSLAEYVREAIILRMAWDHAWRCRQEGESIADAAQRLVNDESPPLM